ncbi:hypothetical protein NDU88_002730 [Pleurodeles waltl]|uniref:Uncharacterized protein n=1 Tax=Pleurodeles waltl TaxID=8319 RepID=A0AAV7UWG7_PLEWA|nr:hypothetical protein NDU88_002730 [Pleurodeles waltl]
MIHRPLFEDELRSLTASGDSTALFCQFLETNAFLTAILYGQVSPGEACLKASERPSSSAIFPLGTRALSVTCADTRARLPCAHARACSRTSCMLTVAWQRASPAFAR